MKNTAFLALSSLTLALLAAGCGTSPPAPLADRSAYDAVLGRVAQAGGAGLLVSACAYRDEVGSDAVLLESSAVLADGAAAATGRYLTDVGVPPRGLATRVVVPTCASFAFPPGEEVMIKTNADDPAPRPLVVADLYPPGQPADAPGVREAVDHLFQMTFADGFSAQLAQNAAAPVPMSLPLSPDVRATLRAATGHDWLWLVSATNKELSMGKSFGQSLASQTGLIGGMIGAANFTDVPTATRAALVDLATSTRVWRGQMPGYVPGVAVGGNQAINGTFARAPAYSPDWGDTLFAPILRTGMPSPVVVGTAAPPRTGPAPIVAAAAPSAPVVTTTTTVVTKAAPVPAVAASRPAAPTPPSAPAPSATATPTASTALASIVLKTRLPVRTTPRVDAPFTMLTPGAPLQIFSMPTAVPNSPVNWLKVGSGSVQGWSSVPEVRAQY